MIARLIYIKSRIASRFQSMLPRLTQTIILTSSQMTAKVNSAARKVMFNIFPLRKFQSVRLFDRHCNIFLCPLSRRSAVNQQLCLVKQTKSDPINIGKMDGVVTRLQNPKKTFILFRLNFKEVALFILFCAIFNMIATSLLKQILISLMMRVSGTTYIAPVNLRAVLLYPGSVLLILLFLIIITFLSL